MVGNSHQWEAFNSYIDYAIEQQHKSLEQAESPMLMHRTQGAIAMLRKLKLLRNEVNGS
jgi:hypothetical protein